MFEITKYDFDHVSGQDESLKIYFKYTGEPTLKIKIEVVEGVFKTYSHYIGGKIDVKKNNEYWISDIQNRNVVYSNDIIVNFINDETNDILDSKFLRTKKVNINRRSFGSNFKTKNIWVIGDSHIKHNLVYGIDYNKNNYETNDGIINPIYYMALSMNRFVKSDYLSALNNLPIMEGDYICLSVGEIDNRISILKNSKYKSITWTEYIINLVSNFVTSIKEIQKTFPKCKVYYIMPNSPIEDGWIEGDKKNIFLGDFDEKSRFIVRGLFENTIKHELKKNNIEVVDLNTFFTKKNGFVDEKFLIENDHHFKTPNPFLNELKNFFNKKCD